MDKDMSNCVFNEESMIEIMAANYILITNITNITNILEVSDNYSLYKETKE